MSARSQGNSLPAVVQSGPRGVVAWPLCTAGNSIQDMGRARFVTGSNPEGPYGGRSFTLAGGQPRRDGSILPTTGGLLDKLIKALDRHLRVGRPSVRRVRS